MPDHRDKLVRKTPAAGVAAQLAPPVEESWEEDPTGNHEGEELARLRARRPTDERIARLETKHDALAADVGEVKTSLANIDGQMKVWPKLVDDLKGSVDRALQREHVTFTTSVDVGKAQDLSNIKVREAQALDPLDAAKQRREWITKALAIVSTVTAIGLAALQLLR